MRKGNKLKVAISFGLACCLLFSGVSVAGVKAEKKAKDKTVISSSEMQVLVDTTFPRVISYTMNDSKKVMDGQPQKLNTMLINGKEIQPKVDSVVKEDKIVYTLTAKNKKKDIDAVLTAEFFVEENTLTFQITKIQDNKMVSTIEFPNQNLVSVNSGQKGANLQGANMSTNTHISGDREVLVNKNLDVEEEAKKGYMYAFVSNQELSAGLFSNSENKITSDWQRITAAASEKNGVKTLGLSSTYWTYQASAEDRKEDGSIEYQKKSGKIAVEELPICKVAIAEDENQDKKVDWQDGAIAYRKIMNNPLGAEQVPSLVAYRIAMNFGSQAQNPFLMTLDNVKKIALNTDGLGQSILLKGYGSEGHDSGHLNYADIGTRIGGAEEMKVLLEKGKEYGAVFGIHVNASETYPESKYFNEKILRKNEDGSYAYGWNWIDQGININALYDLRNGRVDRWKDLYDKLGGASNNLDFIYVDVWGNGQSGDNGTWASRQLAKEITGLGWRLAAEWGYAHEYDSTFQHWAADLTYGGYKLKGINSRITRFIRNHQKDSWIGNYPAYGGEADAPLLGGYNMKDFEGWQGRSDYAAYINVLYDVNLPSKFVQNFEVTEWEDGKPVSMSDNGEDYSFTPGMKAVLKSKDEAHTLKIVRKSNDYTKLNAYRTRTMTYDGKKVYEGQEGDVKYLIPWYWDQEGKEVSKEEQKLYHWNTKGGTTEWEVPKGWSDSVKVYRLDDLGKQDEKTVKIVNGKIKLKAEAQTPYVIYKVKKSNETMSWSDGMGIVDSGFNSGSLASWDIKGTEKKSEAVIARSQGDNPMLKLADNKKKVLVRQKLTGLKPNTRYAAYVGLDNRSAAQAGMMVTGGKKTAGNSGGTSIAQNFIQAYAHNTNPSTATRDDISYFQNLYVFFETGADVSNVTLSLTKEPGAGAAYFDDVRICENNSANWDNWEKQNTFTQDFENTVQGIYPFVIGNIEDVQDNRTHLAELHAPYTQRGWNGKLISDVLQGKWSVKTNGLVGRDKLVYQTIPQNFKFEPGVSYEITFHYETGSNAAYSFVTGDGDYLNDKKAGILESVPFASTVKEKAGYGTFTYTFVAPKSGQGWIGVYSNSDAPKTPDGLSSGDVNFKGYKDFMLDNLVIRKSDVKKEELKKLIQDSEEQNKRMYTKESFSALEKVLADSIKVFNTYDTTQKEVDQTLKNLQTAFRGLLPISYTKETTGQLVTDLKADYSAKNYKQSAYSSFELDLNFADRVAKQENPKVQLLEKAYLDLVQAEITLKPQIGKDENVEDPTNVATDRFAIKAGSFQPDASGEGDPNYVADGKMDTIWHTSWDGTARENMWIEFEMKQPSTINGLRYTKRQSGSNGLISKYRIDVSTDQGTTFKTVKEGEWSVTDNTWQKAEFEQQKEVTNVRMYAVESTGDFAAAAEIRLIEPLKSDQNAPTGLETVDTLNGTGGAIQGTTAAMEYSTTPTGSYRTCTDRETTGLKAGTYYVRFLATDTQKAGNPIKVIIL